MEISFATRRLQRQCETEDKLRRTHGGPCAKQIGVRLKDLEAAASLAEFRHLPGKCHELGAERDGQLALHLPDGKRLIFEPAEEPPPASVVLDWSEVRAVRILQIADYH